MKNVEMHYLNKKELPPMLPVLFCVLHTNMSEIAPTNHSYEEDFAIWSKHILSSMQAKNRQIVLMYVDIEFAGYFQYSINTETGTMLMGEMEIKKEFQGRGLLSSCFKWLIPKLPKDLKTIEAYANKNNERSQCILMHLGMVQSGENKNGNSFYYRGQYISFYDKYSK